MKKTPIYLSLLLLLTCAKEDNTSLIEGYQLQISQLNSKITEYSNQVTQLQSTVNSLNSQVNTIPGLEDTITSLNEQIGELEDTITTLTSEVSVIPDLNDEITSLEETIASLNQQIESLELILNPIDIFSLNSYENQRSGIVFLTEGPWGGLSTPAYTTNVGWTQGGAGFGNGQAYHDINNDGYQDILVSRNYDFINSIDRPSLDWYLNSGDNKNYAIDRTYINGNTYDIRAHKILKTDVNNDNLADFIALGVDERVVGNYGGNFTVLIQNENRRFDMRVIDEGSGLWYHNGAAGDINGDGNVDVVAATYIWLGDGAGNFENTGISVHDYGVRPALSYEVIDINNDNINDIIVGTAKPGPDMPGSNTSILLGTSSYSVYNIIELPDTNTNGTMDLEFMDIDQDGDIDILEGRYFEDSSSMIFAYINNDLNFSLDILTFQQSLDGNNTNIPPQDICPGCRDKYGWSNFKIDDIDNDGVDDIVVENWHDGEFTGLKLINGVWTKWSFFQF